MTSNNNQYSTAETALATYLVCEGFKLLSIDYSSSRYVFKFNSNSDILTLSEKYLTGKALVDPAKFTRINKTLLHLVKNQLQWSEVNNG
jgi:hypothetical protein